MSDYYNSSHTGAQIDNAVSAVISKEATWDGKQDELVSQTNIKSINGDSILGSGNLTVSGSAYALAHGSTDDIITLSKDGTVQDTITINDVAHAIAADQDSDGNSISGSYVKKIGDTMTGTLTGTDIIENNVTVSQQINQGNFHWILSNGYLVLQYSED